MFIPEQVFNTRNQPCTTVVNFRLLFLSCSQFYFESSEIQSDSLDAISMQISFPVTTYPALIHSQVQKRADQTREAKMG